MRNKSLSIIFFYFMIHNNVGLRFFIISNIFRCYKFFQSLCKSQNQKMVRSSLKRCGGRFFGQLKNDECSFFEARFGYFDDTISLAILNTCIGKKTISAIICQVLYCLWTCVTLYYIMMLSVCTFSLSNRN